MARMQKTWPAVLVMVVTGVVGAAVLPSAAIAEGKCDGKAKPCPLQQWMRDNVGTPMASGDFVAVSKGLEKVQTSGGPNMTDWTKFAKKTIDDLKANKSDDVKADCKTCHDAYKQAFKNNATLRNKPLP